MTNPSENSPFETTPAGLPSTGDPAAPAAPAVPKKRLTRSTSDKMLGGVCGGIADYFGVDATLVRIAFVASCLLPGPQILLYVLLWIVIPQDD